MTDTADASTHPEPEQPSSEPSTNEQLVADHEESKSEDEKAKEQQPVLQRDADKPEDKQI